MKNLFIVLLALVALLQSCKQKDACADTVCPNGQICVDGTCQGSNTNTIVTSNITNDVYWTKDKIYEINGRVTVVSGATLFIEAGTIIKFQTGTGANASALLVARGGSIVAAGTPIAPIIMTSVADDITIEQVASGNFASPNLQPTTSGLWGGLIILGKAPISASANEIQIEGIPTTDANGLYGGSNPNDNSGILKYVSIRHGGANIGNGNEINGLTLGGVGSGTVVENIEIVGNQDDGIEFFGGTVTVNHFLVSYSGDDAIDVDQSWSGTLDNFLVVCGPATDHALEIDGPEGLLLGACNIKNGSVQGAFDSELADFRACPRGTFENIFFFGFSDPALNNRGDFSITNPSTSTCSTDNLANGILVFSNLQAILPINSSIGSIFLNGIDAYATSVTTNSVGGSKSVFTWTWTSQANLLSAF